MSYRTFGENEKWTIAKGPNIQKSCWQLSGFSDTYEARMTVFPTEQGNSSHRPGERDIKLEISIPSQHARYFGTLSIPTATYGKGYNWNQAAWEDGLAEIVAGAIEMWGHEHEKERDAFTLVARQIRGERKTLYLNDTASLQGGLRHDRCPSLDRVVKILGDVDRNGTVQQEVICAFKVPRTQYPSDETDPPIKLTDLHPQWCPRLAELTLNYIEELAKYAEGDQRIQTFLTILVKTYASKSQWRQTARRIHENLTRVPEELQPKVIEGLVRLQGELGLTIA